MWEMSTLMRINDVILEVFRSNHDVGLIIASADEIYYALNVV